MNKTVYKSIVVTCLLVVSAGAGWFVATSYIYDVSQAEPPRPPQQHAPSSAPKESPPKPETSRLVMVGDMLIHDTIYKDFRTDDGFDFRPAFHSIKPVVSSADFAILNQETILGGQELGLSGLYQANSPQDLGRAYVDAGFNMIQLANNHANDRGSRGVRNTLKFWEQQDEVITSGVYKEDGRPPIPTITRNGITAAFLTYTYGSNLGDIPGPYQLNYIDRDRIRRDVTRAQTQADVVVVGAHWGVEKSRRPSQRQRKLARFLNNLGVDIVYGTHPHVLQPPDKLTNNAGHETYVFYSLGNFLSIHTEKPPHTLTGAIAGVNIQKDAGGDITISDPFALPTWNYFGPQQKNFTVMPFEDVHPRHFRYGAWPEHRRETGQFLQSQLPELDIVGRNYFTSN